MPGLCNRLCFGVGAVCALAFFFTLFGAGCFFRYSPFTELVLILCDCLCFGVGAVCALAFFCALFGAGCFFRYSPFAELVPTGGNVFLGQQCVAAVTVRSEDTLFRTCRLFNNFCISAACVVVVFIDCPLLRIAAGFALALLSAGFRTGSFFYRFPVAEDMFTDGDVFLGQQCTAVKTVCSERSFFRTCRLFDYGRIGSACVAVTLFDALCFRKTADGTCSAVHAIRRACRLFCNSPFAESMSAGTRNFRIGKSFAANGAADGNAAGSYASRINGYGFALRVLGKLREIFFKFNIAAFAFILFVTVFNACGRSY